jgi:SAM-dependent methyltransferase
MNSAGDGLPGSRGVTRTARPTSQSEPSAHRDWNATDELGYFYTAPPQDLAHPFFANALSDYVSQTNPDPVNILQAGCTAPLRELGIARLTDSGLRVSVTVADEDTPLTRQVLDATGEAYEYVITGDLRTVAIPQRAFDIVYCAGLLERVRHVELVLDHLTGALRPGGLLMIRMGDRRTAAALLDRRLPSPVRRRMWRSLHPGTPGPFPAVYEKPVSERGIYSYTLMRGLVVAQHAAEPTLQTNPARLSSTVRGACTVISRLSRGRFGDDHDELLYVIRKPQNRFARVV